MAYKCGGFWTQSILNFNPKHEALRCRRPKPGEENKWHSLLGCQQPCRSGGAGGSCGLSLPGERPFPVWPPHPPLLPSDPAAVSLAVISCSLPVVLQDGWLNHWPQRSLSPPVCVSYLLPRSVSDCRLASSSWLLPLRFLSVFSSLHTLTYLLPSCHSFHALP